METHEIYLKLCRMQRDGLLDTDEYRELNRAYHAAIDAEIRAQREAEKAR